MSDRLKSSALFSAGYGYIPKLVMQDRELHAIAKAIYSYFCSFTGAGNNCFPSRQKICYDLGLNVSTYSKYLRQLTERGYITTEQIKENGHFSYSIYTLTDEPCTKIPYTETPYTENTVHGDLAPKINIYKKEQNSIKETEGEKPPAREKPTKHKYGEYHHVLLSDEDHEKLVNDLGENAVKDYIQRLDEYIEQHGKSYKNHALTIRNWYKRDHEKKGGYSTTGNQYENIYDLMGGKKK